MFAPAGGCRPALQGGVHGNEQLTYGFTIFRLGIFEKVSIRGIRQVLPCSFLYYLDVSKSGEAGEKMTQGRWTDLLKKQGDKWVMIGDHGGPDDDDD